MHSRGLWLLVRKAGGVNGPWRRSGAGGAGTAGTAAPTVAGGGTGSPDLPGHMGGGTGDTTEDQGGVASLSHAPCPFGILWEVRGSVPATSPLFWGQIGRVASSVGKPSRPLQGQQHQEAFGGH